MGTNNFTDNVMQLLGYGVWTFWVYDNGKESKTACGPYEGNLLVGKDFHRVSVTAYDNTTKCIVSIPSQNVALVEDRNYIYEPKSSQ